MGTTLDLASASHQASSDKNLQSSPGWLVRSLEGLEEESLAEFPGTTPSSYSDHVL